MNPSLTIPLNILRELTAYFIVNVERDSSFQLVKFCREIEKNHWLYLDEICLSDRSQDCTLNEFTYKVFQHVPSLSGYLNKIDEILDNYNSYKNSIPTYGAILLSKDLKVLLLQSFCSNGLWGFPKGKIEENEDPLKCAIREVYEETNVDITKLIKPDWFVEGKLENSWGSCNTRLYIIPNAPMNVNFVAKFKNEIKSWEWFSLDHLFTAKRGTDGGCGLKVTSHTLYMTTLLQSFLEEKKIDVNCGGNKFFKNN